MHVPERKPVSVSVLNTIQAVAADITFGPGGAFTVTDLGEVIKLGDGEAFAATAFAAGTASVKEYNLAAVSLTAETVYTMIVNVDHPENPEPDESLNRSYTVSSGTTVPTADELRDLFIARINLDTNRKVEPASGGAGIVELTLNDIDIGDFNVPTSPAGTVEAVTTPFVAKAGTPAQVELLAPGQSSATATYKEYELQYRRFARNNAISGAFTHQLERVLIFADTGATNFAAFDTEMLAIMAGTHTPVADYLGV